MKPCSMLETYFLQLSQCKISSLTGNESSRWQGDNSAPPLQDFQKLVSKLQNGCFQPGHTSDLAHVIKKSCIWPWQALWLQSHICQHTMAHGGVRMLKMHSQKPQEAKGPDQSTGQDPRDDCRPLSLPERCLIGMYRGYLVYTVLCVIWMHLLSFSANEVFTGPTCRHWAPFQKAVGAQRHCLRRNKLGRGLYSSYQNGDKQALGPSMWAIVQLSVGKIPRMHQGLALSSHK